MSLARFLFIASFFIFSISSRAQEPIPIHMKGKDGLPDNTFFSMQEDKDRMMWFATKANQRRVNLINASGNINLDVEIVDRLYKENKPASTKEIITYFLTKRNNNTPNL